MRTTETFGAMLRRLRTSAGLTQERLAERSAISANGVAALEAGRRKTPRLNTVMLLCDALKLDPDQRALLIAASRETGLSAPGDPASPHDLSGGTTSGDTTSDGLTGQSAESGPRTGTSFVGRHDERAALHDAWERKARVALLFGEAGVGKSTLAEEFAAELATRNVTVLRGRSTPQQLGAYEAFVEPMRAGLGRFDGVIPTSLRDLGRLVPGLIDIGNDVLVPSRSDPAVERRLLFETVGGLLASGGPTLLLLDDLHWADDGTLALLSFLAAQTSLSDLMILGTIRSTDLTPSTGAALAELRRHCVITRINLSGLSRSELVELVATVAGQSVSTQLIDAVTTATNGNPLYIKELTEHLLQRGFEAKGETPVPDGIRQTIGFRVDGLSKEGQALLRGGSVLGQTFELELAGQLVALSGEDLLGAVEDALLSGLLVEEKANVAAFSHGLVATTVYETMSQSRRVALHRSAANALVDRAPTSTGEIVNLARHWAVVADADPLVRETAAAWSVRAGDAAAASAAVDEAIACYARAAALCDGPTAGHAQALVRLGSALTATGRMADGNEHLQRGLEYADIAGDSAVFARAALGLSASVRYTQSDPQRIAELEAAIEKLGPTEMVLRPALLATLRRQLGFVNTPEADRRRNEAASLVAEVVSATDVSDELLISLGSLRDSLVLDDPVPLGELARKIMRVAKARQDLPVLSTGLYRQAWSAMELGESTRFREAVSEYRRIAEQLRRPYELALSSNMIAAIAQIEGRYDDAEAAGQEALAHAATIDDGNFSWVYFANSGLRAVDNGLIAPTFEMMCAVRADSGGMATFEAAHTAMAAAAGHFALADELIEEQVGKNGEILERDWIYLSAERLPVVGMLAWACGMSGNVAKAVLLRNGLARIANLGVRVVRIAPVGAWIGPIDHHLGALDRVVGNLDDAERHLRKALVVEDEMNGRPYRIRTLLELASVGAARGGASGDAQAAAWRGEAEDLAVELGLESIVRG